ncbi:SRPBCC family protein [Promicromonospora kroppenstedtii]|uniref:SRPBCC family protein n=1 Tax=Promicromonospora kroppenstedtii TaxID=440482 RepID=UPI0004B26771|nr:SRPBCC family protein [Promicromonospora kroppenstedtii]
MSNESTGTTDRAGSQPLTALKESAGGYVKALANHAVDSLTDRVSGLSERLTDYANGSGEGGGAKATAAAKGAEQLAQGASPVKAGLSAAVAGVKDKVKETFGGGSGGGGGGGKKFAFNNIVESIDVGAPVEVVFNAWTSYEKWPEFMKKVEHTELDEESGEVQLKGQVFWSHRQWDTVITDQVPDQRIVWKSSGAKGHLSGVVTFHELADDLTRLVLVVSYYPQGFMEKTGNIWRAVNRRVRLELKYFVRHVMTESVLRPEEDEGFRAEIRDEEMIRSHQDVVEDEQAARDEEEGDEGEEEEEGGNEEEEGDEEEETEDTGSENR